MKLPKIIEHIHNHMMKGKEDMIKASNNLIGTNPKGKIKDVYSAKDDK